jgi:hypothetical protein
MGIQSWSTTAADNDDSDATINWTEGQQPSTVNNSARAMMAVIAAWRDAFGGVKVSGGAANAYTLTTGLSLTSYQTLLLAMEANHTNTGASTIAIDGLTARNIKTPAGTDPVAGAITAGGIYLLSYESGADVVVLLNPAASNAYSPGGTDVAVADGGTGASTAAGARTNLELVGQQTIWVPAAAMAPRITNGAAPGSLETGTNDVMAKYLAYDSSTSEAAQIAIQMPKSWNEGTIIAQFVWTHPATVTNFGVRWGIRAVAFANDDALDTAFGTEQEVSDTGGTTSDVYISDETAAMTVAGTPAAEELVIFEVYRDPADGADTMAVDAYLLGVKLHYTTDAARDD